MQTQNANVDQPQKYSASDKTQATDTTTQEQTSTIPLPSLERASEIRGTKIEGVYLGMAVDSAVSTLKEKGYRVERRGTSRRKFQLGGAKEYLIEYIEMRKGEVEPFPGGKMTREESNAYQTRIAKNGVHLKSVNLSAYKGHVGQIHLSGSSFDKLDAVKAYVLKELGAANDEDGFAGGLWNLIYFQDLEKRSLSDTQLWISIKNYHYTDLIKQENVPYTQIRYRAWLYQTIGTARIRW